MLGNTTLPKVPELKFNKTGFEIRSDVLAMAKEFVLQDFRVKFQGWELTAERDEKTGQIVSKVEMPQFPGIDKLLETAEQMYKFVSVPKVK